MDNKFSKPLHSFDLKALGDPGAAVRLQRLQGEGSPIDWSRCGLASFYGHTGDSGHTDHVKKQALVA